MKQESSVPKECCYISLTNMPTPPPPPPAQMCVFLCVVYVFEMDDLHSLAMRSLWSFDATKSCARWGWALNLCQHPAWIPGPFSNSNTTCLCDCSTRPWFHKNHYRLGPRFLIGAIMSQWKLKPNRKLVLSQIQLTDSLPLCFFEKPLMLAGGFCTRSDGNEWYFKRFFFIRRA